MSAEARELVQEILTPDPQQRPSLHDIVDNVFFTRGIVPAYIPNTARDTAPDFRHISRVVSQANLARLRRYALLDEEQSTNIAVPSAPASSTGSNGPAGGRGAASGAAGTNSLTSSFAQQEKEFQKAVQPGSPISALLISARQPLLVAPSNATRESPLLRKLQAAARENGKSPGRTASGKLGALQGIEEEEMVGREEEVRKKELESQKARIVAQMVPVGNSPMDDMENMPPVDRQEMKAKEKEGGREGGREKEKVKEKEKERARDEHGD